MLGYVLTILLSILIGLIVISKFNPSYIVCLIGGGLTSYVLLVLLRRLFPTLF